MLATESTWSPRTPRRSRRRTSSGSTTWPERSPRTSRGSAYQNFIDRSQPDWERAYYGENLKRLIEVKRRYDPDGLFSFEQGIPAHPSP